MLWAVCKDPREGIVGVGECSEHSLPLPSVDPQWRGPDPGQVETGCPVFLSKPAGDRGSRSRCDAAATAGRLAQLRRSRSAPAPGACLRGAPCRLASPPNPASAEVTGGLWAVERLGVLRSPRPGGVGSAPGALRAVAAAQGRSPARRRRRITATP